VVQEHYGTVALQLSDNSLDMAADLVQAMRARSSELEAAALLLPSPGQGLAGGGGFVPGGFYPPSHANGWGTMAGINNTSSPSSSSHINGLSFAASGASATPLRTSLNPVLVDGIPLPPPPTSSSSSSNSGRGNGNNGTSNGLVYNNNNSNSISGNSSSSSSVVVVVDMTCPVCGVGEDSVNPLNNLSNKCDQLVPCTACRRAYHTGCFGGRRIPFNLKARFTIYISCTTFLCFPYVICLLLCGAILSCVMLYYLVCVCVLSYIIFIF
jgi:hypothetical protein